MLVQASQLVFIIFCADLNSPVAGQWRYFALSGVGFGVVRYVLALVSGVFGFHGLSAFRVIPKSDYKDSNFMGKKWKKGKVIRKYLKVYMCLALVFMAAGVTVLSYERQGCWCRLLFLHYYNMIKIRKRV